MVIKYVLKNFSRRKVRTVLMILSLLVSTGLIITMSATVETVRQSNVDLIASAVGRYDIGIFKKDTSLEPFLVVSEVTPRVLAANEAVTAVYPRIETEIELNVNGVIGRGTLLALDPAVDDIGFVDVVDGRYQLGNNQAAILEETALNFNLEVGDTLDVSYSFPLPREVGQEALAGASSRRTTERFTVAAIVRQDGVTGSDVRGGLIIALSDAQAWLNLPDRAQRLVATVDPGLYETNNAEIAALRVRDVVRSVQQQLGDEYAFSLNKASALDGAAEGFLAVQALINTYGLISLGVVGLLVHTLVMTNVQEQRRDMAVLRILGGERRLLFGLVIAEVLVIGAIGVGLGVGLGQLITAYIVVPLIESQMAAQGLNSTLAPQVTLSAVLPAIIAAFVVSLVHFLSLYRLRVPVGIGQMLGAMIAAMSVQWTVSRAVADGLIKDNLPFARTSKGGLSRLSIEFQAFWEAVIGALLLIAILAYVGLYWRGLAAADRYQNGFVIDTCPVCQRGHLLVETHMDRMLGIPRPRSTVRCGSCRSVLRQVGDKQWRYAVDPTENPALYARYNGKVLDEAELRTIRTLPRVVDVRPPVKPPTFVDDEES